MFGETGREVLLFGEPGSGSSALAYWLTARDRERFPGGTFFACGSGGVETLIAELGDDPRLLVLDDIDREPLHSTEALLNRLEQHSPRTRVLMTARRRLPLRNVASYAMPNLRSKLVFGLLRRRSEVEDARLVDLAIALKGNLDAAELIAEEHLARGVAPERVLEWLGGGSLPVSRDARGRTLGQDAPERRAFDIVISEVSEELIQQLAVRPELLYELHWRKFEKLVAELYRRRGCEVTLTSRSGDENVDVYVVSRDDVGETLWVVQAKRWAAHRKVGAGVVRGLYGTVDFKRASAGIVLTTSFFTSGARAIERDLRYRLKLGDYLELQRMLREGLAQ